MIVWEAYGKQRRMEQLFMTPIGKFRAESVNEARKRLDALPDGQILERDIGAVVEEIVGGFRFEVAELLPAERRGKRIVEQIQVREGIRRDVDVSMIEVTIPFSGWPKSFSLAPTRTVMNYTRAAPGTGGLKAKFADDDNLDKNVDDFIKSVSANLENLKADMEAVKAAITEAIRRAVEERVATLKQQQERDRKRSFPIE